jgi:DNA primase large subunit
MKQSGILSASIIPLYHSPPTINIMLDELEKIVQLRIQALDYLESDTQRKDEKHSTLRTFLINHEKEIGWNNNMENDIASHFVLSVAFCKSEQDRNWFSTYESKLFLLRIEEYKIDMIEVLSRLNIPLERQDNLSEDLLDKIKFRGEGKFNSPIFRIPFEYALNLLPTMQYFVHRGFIYITKSELAQIIDTVFKELIIKRLNIMNKNISKLLGDRRISGIVKDIEQRREGLFFLI